MAIDSNTLEVNFAKCAFKPERENLAKFLTSYLIGKKQDGYVLNVNGDWGSGKTFFSKAWLNSIKSSHPAIYIDAWKTDFSSDPIIVVVKQIIDELRAFNSESGIDLDLESKVLKSLYKLTSSSAKIIASGAGAYLGIGAATGKGAAELLLGKLDEIVEGIGQIDYENYKLSYDAMDEFKKSISNLLKSYLSSSDKEGPMFIFIDELDRCRPSYAVEMLEAVKHLFGINNIVFIVTTNTSELKHSISAVYGNGFSSEQYLERFFDRPITLPTPSIEIFIKTSYKEFLEQINESENISLPDGIGPEAVITALLLAENYQLRDIDKFMDILSGAVSWARDNSKNNEVFDFINLVILIVYKKKHPEVFDDIVLTNKYHLEASVQPNTELEKYRASSFYPHLYQLSISSQIDYEAHLLNLSTKHLYIANIYESYDSDIRNNQQDPYIPRIASLYKKRIQDKDAHQLITIKELSKIVDMATILD